MKLYEVRDTIDIFHGPPLMVIADCMRGLLTAAPGMDLIAVDFSQIEARVLPWLAGQDDVLDVFREGRDIYLASANKIYGVPEEMVNKEQRLIGKVAILAMGFGGGIGAFQSMAKVYHVKVSDEMADDIKLKWRAAHPQITAYWYSLENAAVAAIDNPGEKFHVGPRGRHVTYLKKGSFLLCRLPSGRVITYPYPEMKVVRTPWGEPKRAIVYRGEKDRRWQHHVAYGGLLAENCTQATARDLLRDGMFRWEAAGYPVIMHVHDELVCEVRENDLSKTLEEAERLLCIAPEWAKELPIAAQGWRGKRYRK